MKKPKTSVTPYAGDYRSLVEIEHRCCDALDSGKERGLFSYQLVQQLIRELLARRTEAGL